MPLLGYLGGELIMPDYPQVIGRVLLSVVFIVFGYLQFTNIGNYIANPAVVKAAATSGILSPTVIAYLVAAIDLFGGLLILVGYQTRWAAVVLIAFIVLTFIFAHNFWTMEGAARAANQAHFYKNLSLIGGLLLLIAAGPGRYSLDQRS
jgi:putative oxidoreductase